jgi:hypothetical protein
LIFAASRRPKNGPGYGCWLCYRGGNVWKARTAFTVFALLSTLSFSAGVGLYSITKNEAVGDAKATHAAYEQATADKGALKDKLAALGHVRTTGAVFRRISRQSGLTSSTTAQSNARTQRRRKAGISARLSNG